MPKKVKQVFWATIAGLLLAWLILQLLPEPPYQEIKLHMAEYHGYQAEK